MCYHAAIMQLTLNNCWTALWHNTRRGLIWVQHEQHLSLVELVEGVCPNEILIEAAKVFFVPESDGNSLHFEKHLQ